MKGLGPTFIIIGSAKAGTNTLHKIFSQSEQVFFTDPKEPSFFRKNYDNGIEWYLDLFQNARPEQARGEKTVAYSTYSDAKICAERMAKHFPSLKIIFCVRKPAERIVSQWRMLKRYDSNLRNINDLLSTDEFIKTHVDRCKYMEIAQHYIALFGSENVKIVLLDDIENKQEEVVVDLGDFLDVDVPKMNYAKGIIHNSSETSSIPTPKPIISDELMEFIRNYLDEDVSNLFTHIGRDKAMWGF